MLRSELEQGDGAMGIATWNTQGDFTESSKSAVVSELLKNSPVVLIQEGGVNKTWDSGAHCVRGLAVGAFNERCTNYVLVRDDFWDDHCAEINFNAIGGGVAGRSAAGVRIGDTVFVSWHSLSGQDNSDTSALLKECSKSLSVEKDIKTVIIGGDFNTTPQSIEMMTMLSLKGENFAQVINSGKSTHKSGHELDFFVVLSKSYTQFQAVTGKVQPSDHNPVILQ